MKYKGYIILKKQSKGYVPYYNAYKNGEVTHEYFSDPKHLKKLIRETLKGGQMTKYYYCVVDEENMRGLKPQGTGFVEATSIHVALYRLGHKIERDKELAKAVRSGKATLKITFHRFTE